MSSVSKNMHINKLDDILNKNNNTYHSTIKIEPVDVKSSTYIDFDKKNNKEDSKFKVGDYARISKNKNIFAKGYVPNCSVEEFVITKIKHTLPWTFVARDLRGEEVVGTFYEKEFQKQIQKNVG